MTRYEIFQDLKQIARGLLHINESEVDKLMRVDSKLQEDLGIDSVEYLDFIFSIEDFYSIKIRDVEANSFATISDVISLLERKLNTNNNLSDTRTQ